MGKLKLTRRDLSKNVQLIGVTGTGKSTILHQIIECAIREGASCVFLDQALEYTEMYYRPGRDFIVNPVDERGCAWKIGEETFSELEAMSIGEGAFPDKPGTNFFFQDHARSLFAFAVGGDHPLRHKVSCRELAKWMSNPKYLDFIVKGTEHAETLSKNAAEQRAGILGTLNHIGRALRWMPDENEADQQLCISEWGETRDAHIFLTSTAKTFAGVKPMQSLILDMVFQELQSRRGKPVWVIADEIGEFDRCPQLRGAMAKQRKSDCPIVLVYQTPAQMIGTYGQQDAEVIMTNPYTNFVMAQTSQKSAEFCSALLGLSREVIKERESRTLRGMFYAHPHRTLSEMSVKEPPVSAGQIQRLRDGFGFVSQRALITPFEIDLEKSHKHRKKTQPGFVPRYTKQSREYQQFLKDVRDSELFYIEQQLNRLGRRSVPMTDENVDDLADEFEKQVQNSQKTKYKKSYTKPSA